MVNFSKNDIRNNCPHCDPKSFALKYPLQETNNFWIVCDVHPLTKGHILIIPKKHLSCIGEFPQLIFDEFLQLYKKCSEFLFKTYGSISSFEHGKIGQTVFHSHVQMFPFNGSEGSIIPEGKSHISRIDSLEDLKTIYHKQGSYLFFSIGEKEWLVNIKIGKPGFFRDRFANALHQPVDSLYFRLISVYNMSTTSL